MLAEKFFLSAFFIILPSQAFAYLDPGSISIWLQGLLATLALVAGTGRLWWYQVKGFFVSKKSDIDDNSSKVLSEDSIDEDKK